jgi:hypothetical protein
MSIAIKKEENEINTYNKKVTFVGMPCGTCHW